MSEPLDAATVTAVAGARARDKVVAVAGMDVDALREALQAS